MDTIHTILAFTVLIIVLIGVHEYGHFIVARKLGVRVEKFSIGFGPALFSWRSRDGEVEYVLAAIPLGGYVKMLGENPGDQKDEAKAQLSEAEKARAFDAQPVWKRASIAVAGPLFNFFFAIITFTMIGWMGQQVIPPVVGTVAPASVAEQHGMQKEDVIHRVDGEAIYAWSQFEEVLKRNVGGSVEIEVLRGDAVIPFRIELAQPEKDEYLVNVADVSLGISRGVDVIVLQVGEGSPAEAGGLKAGDRIVQVGGMQIRTVRQVIEQIGEARDVGITLHVEREGTFLNLAVTPRSDNDAGVGRIGIVLAEKPLHDPVLHRMGLFEGVGYGFQRTGEMTVMTLQFFKKMVLSSISPENLGGPIAIAQMAGKTAEAGAGAFLLLMAIISVNLAVLNLLPIPVLDGGHLVYLALEKLRGRPLSPEMMEKTQIVGMSLIIFLMIFAFYNDLMRLFRG